VRIEVPTTAWTPSAETTGSRTGPSPGAVAHTSVRLDTFALVMPVSSGLCPDRCGPHPGCNQQPLMSIDAATTATVRRRPRLAASSTCVAPAIERSRR
jgi:hypothetical protein